jgi:hypothetical protein
VDSVDARERQGSGSRVVDWLLEESDELGIALKGRGGQGISGDPRAAPIQADILTHETEVRSSRRKPQFGTPHPNTARLGPIALMRPQ